MDEDIRLPLTLAQNWRWNFRGERLSTVSYRARQSCLAPGTRELATDPSAEPAETEDSLRGRPRPSSLRPGHIPGSCGSLSRRAATWCHLRLRGHRDRRGCRRPGRRKPRLLGRSFEDRRRSGVDACDLAGVDEGSDFVLRSDPQSK